MVPITLQQLTDEVRRFRRERGKSAHLPESLRESAARLAADLGIRPVSRDLDISRNTLRIWMTRYPAPRRSKRPSVLASAVSPTPRPEPIAFFEIKTGPVPAPGRSSGSTASVVELTRPDGSILRVSGELAKELAAAMLDRFTTVAGGTR